LLFPTRLTCGPQVGNLVWQPLTYGRTLQVLHNPLYAGAYAFGRRAFGPQRKPRSQRQRRQVRLPLEAWLVVQWDAFPGYLSRAEYEANQVRLAANRPGGGREGQVRWGAALLSGRVLCGRCGHPMQVAYGGTDGRYPSYVCRPARQQGQNTTCQQLPAANVDASVVQAVLNALTPAALELSLHVLAEIAQQQAELRQQWERQLERVRYEADLARRRYQQVDPENRLVARTLEREWEAALTVISETEQAYRQAQLAAPLTLTAEDRAALAALATDLPTLWAAANTTQAERKELLRLLIADVTLTRQDAAVLVQLRWVTNVVDSWTVPGPSRGARTVPAIITHIRDLAATHTDAQIAAHLNGEGWRTARGKDFSATRVSELRRTHRIVKVQRDA
jgi:hypothetical protein